jgi:hypothetical protein
LRHLPADLAVLNHDIGCDRLPFQEALLKNSISSCPGKITQYLRFQPLCPTGMAYVIKICLEVLLFTVPSGTSVEHRRMSIINADEQYSSELQTGRVIQDCSSYQLPGCIRDEPVV